MSLSPKATLAALLAACALAAPARALPESSHPYANNMNQTWTYAGPANALSLRVTFDVRTRVEPGYDYIFVLDSQGQNVAGSPFTDTELAGRTVVVPGQSVQIRLYTDYTVSYWGFAVTSVVPVVPPPPSPPTLRKPASGSAVVGPPRCTWDPVATASYYKVEWSSDTRGWTASTTAAAEIMLPMTSGSWYWHVSAGNANGLGSPSPNTTFTVIPGYQISMAKIPSLRGEARYRLSLTAYRSPPPARLAVSGLPAGVNWSFNPPELPGSGEMDLRLSGLDSLMISGNYGFTIMAGTTPVGGDVQGNITISGTFAVNDAYAYPNPARGGSVRIRAVFDGTPTQLTLRIYDLAGELVREVSEPAPFSSFANTAPGVYEYTWDGMNGSGRRVASEKYAFWLRAENPAGRDTFKGLFTWIRP